MLATQTKGAAPHGRDEAPSLSARDALAVSDLFETTAEMVHRTAWRITGRPEDAEDVLQSVFLSVLRAPPEPWPEQPEAYVHRAAVNASLDLLRRRKRHLAAVASDAIEAPGAEASVQASLDEARLVARLREAFLRLSPLEAEVFSLRFFEERSNAEIASLLGKTANHVGVTLHAARQKLRDALGDVASDEKPGIARRGEFA